MSINNWPPQGGKNADIRLPSRKSAARIALMAVLALLLLIVFIEAHVIVDEGHIGVKYRFGRIVADNIEPGISFMLPFVETVEKVDVREQVYQTTTTAYTRDTQTVENLAIKLNYYYDGTQLSYIVRNVGIRNVESKLIVPQVNAILKNEIGQFRAEELVQSRGLVQTNIQAKLLESLSRSGIVVVSFAIENIDFESGFEEAVRAKVVAEQDALKMQNKTHEIEELAKQTVIQAQAEAEASRIQAEAEAYAIEIVRDQLSASPQYIEYEKIKRWDGRLPVAIGEGINPFLVFGSAEDYYQ